MTLELATSDRKCKLAILDPKFNSQEIDICSALLVYFRSR